MAKKLLKIEEKMEIKKKRKRRLKIETKKRKMTKKLWINTEKSTKTGKQNHEK